MKKKYLKIILACIVAYIILCFILYKPSEEGNTDTKEETTSSKVIKSEYEFEQVGYFKKNKLRYFTFYVDGIKNDSITKQLLEIVREHGSKKMNTPGNVTASFYYLNEENTPNITTAINGQSANEIAHKHNPFVAVWIMPNGQVNLIENPK